MKNYEKCPKCGSDNIFYGGGEDDLGELECWGCDDCLNAWDVIRKQKKIRKL